MSSDSEEEFQSADEGSDDDGVQPIISTGAAKPTPQQQPLGINAEDKVAFILHNDAVAGNSSIGTSSQPEKLLEDSTVDAHHSVTDTGRQIDLKPSHIKKSQEDREASPIKDEVENDVEDWSTEENEDVLAVKSKTDTTKPTGEMDDCDDKIEITDTGSDACSKVLQGLKISDERKNHEDIAPVAFSEEEEMATKKFREETKRELVTWKCDTEAEKKSEPEKNEGIIDSSTADSLRKDLNSDKSLKRPRESKIGMKKPREKLGERLGAKKLGSRVEKKSLDGVGSDDVALKPQVSNSREGDLTDSQEDSQRTGCASEGRSREDEKRTEKRLEEERWQQVQQQETRQQFDDGTSSSESGWGGGWGGWGSSLLSAASTFTREVGRGVGTVMETVESGLGVPDAETMAKEIVEHQKKKEENEVHIADAHSTPTSENPTTTECEEREKVEVAGQGALGGMWLGSLVSGVSGALETAGSKVLMGGLDTLEVIGRKAMDVIQEGDPGLRKKRAFLTNNKPNLSQVLQDARMRAAEEEKGRSVCDGGGPIGVTLEATWDGTEGGVHLEALSLVSRQCEAKNASMMATLPHYILNSLSASNSKIKSACEVGEEGDMEGSLEGDLNQHIEAIITHTTLPLNISRISQAWSKMQELDDTAGTVEGVVDEGELYQGVAEVVAQVAALAHKAAEMALTMPEVDPLALATNFRQLSCSVWGSVEGVTDRICGSITASASTPDAQVNDTITNIYLQVSHGSKYIQQSMGYLSPVLQYVNTKRAASDF